MKSAQEYRSLAAKAAAEALDPRYPTILRARFGAAERAYRRLADQTERLTNQPDREGLDPSPSGQLPVK
jgi:hypothetical protein